MLKLKNLFENFELAREVLELYDVDDGSLDRYLPHFRVSSNAVYPFAMGSDPARVCILRMSPAEEKSYEDVLSEIRLINWLIGNGCPAMRPHPMKDGRLSAQLNTRWGTYNISCFERVQGRTLEDLEGTPEIVRGYGRTLGDFHRLVKRYPYADERRDHAELLEEVHDRLTAFHAPECVLKEYAEVRALLAVLPSDPSVYGLVHYDFEADNVLFDPETGAFGIIDFDDAIRCWYALDVVRAIDALGDVTDAMDRAEARSMFLEGYREKTEFTQEQEASIPLMRRLVHLQEYASILYVLSEGVPDEPDWMTDIRGILNRKLQELTAELQ